MILESNVIVLPIYKFFTGLFRLILNAQIPDYRLKTHFIYIKCIFIQTDYVWMPLLLCFVIAPIPVNTKLSTLCSFFIVRK